MDVLPLGLTGDGALRAAVAADREVTRMEGVRLDHLSQYLGETAASWTPPEHPTPGSEQAIRLGGPGTPLIPEFAVCEIAAALGLSQPAATSLCADVLDLGYRIRRIADCVRSGELAFTRARMIARRTRNLPAEKLEAVQERLCRPRHTVNGPVPLVALVPMSRLRSLVDQAVIAATGPQTEADQQASIAASLYVELVHETGGATDLNARLASADASRLDQRLDQIAGWLTQAGDTRPKSVLRAVAMGLLADPGLLSALQQHNTSATTATDATSAAAAGVLGAAERSRGAKTAPDASAARDVGDEPDSSTAPGIAGCPAGLLKKFAAITSTVLYLHLDRESGTWTEETTGALSSETARQIVGHSNVSLRPVLDLAADLTYTGYTAPPRLKEQLALTNAGYCTFPHCHRRARTADVDHQIPYARGGPTTSSNTHRLCTKHHRAKDKGRWRVLQPAPGIWIWTSPAGATYLVTNATTTPLGSPSERTRPVGPAFTTHDVTHDFIELG